MAASTAEAIINFAIDKECESATFYEDLAKKAEDPLMKDAILSMADQERKHEKILRNLSPNRIHLVSAPSQPDLKLANYLAETTFSKDATYQELLLMAMKREEKSYALYSDLEQRACDDVTRKVFTLLKGEELKHKTRLEKEYKEHVMRED